MADLDFTAPKVKRGRLTNFRTGNFIEFAINPSSIKDAKGSNWSEDNIPGYSDPLIRWASGKTGMIQFELHLDGETRLRRSGVNLLNGSRPEPVENALGFSIAGELEFFGSLDAPTDPTLPGATGGPDLVVFSFGSYFGGVLCAYELTESNITEFDPDLNPTRAVLQITLRRIQNTNRYANQIWSPPVEGFNT